MLVSPLSLAVAHPTAGFPYPWLFFVMTGVLLVGVLILGFFLFRRMYRAPDSVAPEKEPVPRAENEPAFMTASMQAVIQKLRTQEKELERLHKIERERAETTARISEEVTRNMPSGLLVVGANGLISASNPAAEQALGIQGLAFRRFSEALGENSTLTAMIQQCLSSGTVFQREQAVHVTPNGAQRELGVTISPIRRSNEKTTGTICLLTDLTELSSLQKQMRLRENLAALGELSAGIAHEFKNALATISGYAQMIAADPAASDNSENAAKILSQTRSITHVVAEFLRYARPLDLSEESVALRPLLERVFAEIGQTRPTVRFVLEGDFSEVPGDEGLLRQVFLNLVRNAADAAASSDNPTVTVRGIRSSAGNSSQLLHILDNGPGLPPASESKLFRPFFTTKIDGTGLGLAVVQKILLQHSAQITAQDRPEGGAEFIVTLPVESHPHPEAVESKEVAI